MITNVVTKSTTNKTKVSFNSSHYLFNASFNLLVVVVVIIMTMMITIFDRDNG